MPPHPSRDTAAQAHHDAVTAFVAAARAVPPDDWERPLAHDKWSPAQVAEHLRLTYVLVAQQLAGGSGIRVRTPWWLRSLLRWRVLPRILSRGALPEGARAPREIRPGNGPFDREQTLSAMVTSASVVEDALLREWDDKTTRMTHHVFGALRAPTAMRLSTVHVTHHARQLTRAG
jgi:hypothetical protein